MVRARSRVAVFALLLAAASAQATAEVLTRSATGVSRILFSLPGELQVRPGSPEQVSVDAEASVLAKLDIAVRGDTLVLSSKGSFRAEKPIRITVTLRALHLLKSEGSGNAVIDSFSEQRLEVAASGSGHLALKNVKADHLLLAITGASDIDVFGSGKALVARIEGTGTIDAVSYRAKAVNASISGAGNIKVHADESLKAFISGSGTIEYEGNAKVSQSVPGVGSVERL